MRKNKMKALLTLVCAATLATGAGIVALNAPVANADAAHTEAIFMANGASIRYSAPAGIRFTGYVKDDGDLSDNVVGVKVSVGGIEKDFSTASIEGAEWKWAASEVAGYKKFHVAITGIPESQYETEMTAQAYVDNEVSAEIVTRSIATVANAALTAEAFEETLTAGQLTSLENYINDEAVALPFGIDTQLFIENGSLTFEAVENAKGYLVQVGDEIKNVPATEAEKYSVAIGEYTTVSIIPYGDGVAYRCAIKPRAAFTDSFEDAKTLADFNEDLYTAMISVAEGNFKQGNFRAAPTFTEGSDKVNVVLYYEDYHDTEVKNADLAPFMVTLPKALNLESEYDGIQIKLNSLGTKATGVSRLRLEAFNGMPTGDWNDTASTAVSDWYGVKGEMTLKVTMAQLKALGYQTGDTVLSLAIRSDAKVDASSAEDYFVNIDVEDISYYEGVVVPMPVSKTLLDFNDASSVSAIGTVAGKHYYGTFKAAPNFKSADGRVNFALYYDDYHTTAVNETDLAAFTVTLPTALNVDCDYEGIEIKLYMLGTQALGGNRPKLRIEAFRGTPTGDWNDTASTVVSDWYGDGVTFAAQEMILKISMVQLKALGYQTGDTVLTLAIRRGVKADNSNNTGHMVNFDIDDISYYEGAVVPTPVSKTLLDFNDASSVSAIGAVPGNHYGGFVATANPSFKEGGSVNFAPYYDDYHETAVKETDLALFTVTLPTALNLECDYGGIEIKINMLGTKAVGIPKFRLELFKGTPTGAWNDTASSAVSEWYGDGVTKPTGEMTLKVSMAQLKALGYQTGDKVLTIAIRSHIKMDNSGGVGNFVLFDIDDISYYEKEEGG